jgi:DNA-cytosine methyltransferase
MELKNKLRVFESFAGYGSQSIALQVLKVPYEVVALSEIEPNVIIGYGAIRGSLDQPIDKTDDEIKKWLMDRNIAFDFKKGKSTVPKMKKDKMKLLYNACIKYNNLGDISIIKTEDIPNHDLFTMSSPCQDFSISGKGEGGFWICNECAYEFNPIDSKFKSICPHCNSIEIKKTKSSLLFECAKVIETKSPSIILMENVKNIVGKKHIEVFNIWCKWLEEQGYENKYAIINARDCQIAQNRERVIMFSVKKDSELYNTLAFNNFEFPKPTELKWRLKHFLEDEVDEGFYLSDDVVERFKEQYVGNNIVGTTKSETQTIGQREIVFNEDKIMGTLGASDYKQAKQFMFEVGEEIIQADEVKSEELKELLNKTPCIVASRGRYNEDGSTSQQYEPNKDGVSNTITTVTKDNLVVEDYEVLDFYDKEKEEEEKILKEQFRKNFILDDPNLIQLGSLKVIGCMPYAQMHDQSGRIYSDNGLCPTISTMQGGNLQPKVLCCEFIDKDGNIIIKYFRLRKLTPKECFRLMGMQDKYFDRIQLLGISNSALYCMAGNSIVINVLINCFGKLFQVDNYEEITDDYTRRIVQKSKHYNG